MTSAKHPTDCTLLLAAGALISVRWDDADEERRRAFEDTWRDVLTDGGGQPDADVAAAEHVAPEELADEIRRLARVALEPRDLWTVRGTAVARSRSAIIILGESAEATLSLLESLSGRPFSLGDRLIAIDPHGKVLAHREPLNGRPLSTIDGVVTVPAGMRVKAIVLISSAADEEVRRLDLLDSLVAMAPFVDGLTGMPEPLRSFARVVADAGGVIVAGTQHSEQVAHLIDLHCAHPPTPLTVPAESEPRDASELGHGAGMPRFYRAGAVEALDFSDQGVLLLRRSKGERTILALDRTRSAFWRAANGVNRGALLVEVASDLRDSPRSALDEVFRRMESEGLVANEPSWRVSNTATWAVQGESVVVLDLAAPDARPVLLEASACAVWLELSRRAPIPQSQLVAEVAAQFEVDSKLIESDIEALLAKLQDENLSIRF